MGGGFLALLRGDVQAERAIPKRGFTAQLTTVVAGVLSFLAVFVLALSLSASRIAKDWASDLGGATTVQLPADRADDIESVLQLLRNTPGVTEARALTADEEQALLAPWLGTNMPVDLLPVPKLIDVTTDETFDAAAVAGQLAVVGATLNDHDGWREPLAEVASRLRTLGWVTVGLITLALLGLVTLAARLSLTSNTQTIGVLRLVGATDTYIAHAFMRRLMLRAATGAAIGTVIGFLVMRRIATIDSAPEFNVAMPFDGWQALWLVLIPVLSGGAALLATQFAAHRTLREIP